MVPFPFWTHAAPLTSVEKPINLVALCVLIQPISPSLPPLSHPTTTTTVLPCWRPDLRGVPGKERARELLFNQGTMSDVSTCVCVLAGAVSVGAADRIGPGRLWCNLMGFVALKWFQSEPVKGSGWFYCVGNWVLQGCQASCGLARQLLFSTKRRFGFSAVAFALYLVAFRPHLVIHLLSELSAVARWLNFNLWTAG